MSWRAGDKWRAVDTSRRGRATQCTPACRRRSVAAPSSLLSRTSPRAHRNAIGKTLTHLEKDLTSVNEKFAIYLCLLPATFNQYNFCDYFGIYKLTLNQRMAALAQYALNFFFGSYWLLRWVLPGYWVI